METSELKKISHEIRLSMLEVIRPKETHHIGCAYSIVDILTYLYFNKLNVDPRNPKSKNRDIFLLSKGHAGLALYAVLSKKGFFGEELLKTYDQDGGHMPEHASSKVPGIELSTGSLGHALPVANGFAVAFKNDRMKNHIYVILSDGELDEGSNWEAVMFAFHHKLDNITVIVDRNGFQGYSATEKVIDLSPLTEKFKVFGWEVAECDGHDFESLGDAIKSTTPGKPKVVIAKTIKGKGIPYFENKFESHYKSLDEQTLKELIEQYKQK